ncbi:MAG TPA: nuclease, partial [Hyphomonadaceae bacterium]|nr:nuclease [Hyphomonadaceae bacterium]
MIRAAAFLLITLGLAACSADDPSSNWARGQTGTVSRVIDGDSFVLDDGLVVRLVSI